MNFIISYKNEGGSALIYILIAIALLAALTFTFMEPSSQQTSSQNTFKTVAALQGQADMIRSAIQECVLSYPKGDSGLKAVHTNARDNYPIDPDSTYYSGTTIDQAGNSYVRNMRCPGNNPGGADVAEHTPIFGGNSGKFFPPPPDLFEEWEIYNDDDGVYFWTYTTNTDAFLVTSLNKIDDAFSECEADVIDASSSDRNLDSNGDTVCASGSYCFRVRMITNAATAEWNGDTDGEELAAGCDP
jgi:hypothetical protein